MTKKLYVISEGGLHTLEYLVRRGIYPDYYFIEPLDMKKYIPYIKEEDDVLVLVNGLTDFSLVDLYTIINDLLISNLKMSITVMSTVKLIKFPVTYYRYTGDLFYSKVYGVSNEKRVELDSGETKKKGQKETKSDLVINKVILPFLAYNKEKEVDIITDNSFKKKEIQKKESLYSSLIHNVNLFGG